MKDKPSKDDKDNFLKVLSSLTKEELYEFINSKGKEPKLVAPVVYLK